jgi:hypothetical protein
LNKNVLIRQKKFCGAAKIPENRKYDSRTKIYHALNFVFDSARVFGFFTDAKAAESSAGAIGDSRRRIAGRR